MKTVRVYIVVEGQTEETFTKEVLDSYFSAIGIYLYPISLKKRGQPGGNVKYERAEIDISILLKQDKYSYCTTFFDYYGIDPSFPGKQESRNKASAEEKAKTIESAFREKIISRFNSSFDQKRFIPYIQMHEFEGLLFSDPEAFAKGIYREEISGNLREIRDGFSTPEDINDDSNTAPSKRILNLYPSYKKPLLGALAAIEIGLDVIRRECPHFNQWLKSLEALGRI